MARADPLPHEELEGVSNGRRLVIVGRRGDNTWRLTLGLGGFPFAPLALQLGDPVAALIVPILSAFRRSSFRLPALALPTIRLFFVVHDQVLARLTPQETTSGSPHRDDRPFD